MRAAASPPFASSVQPAPVLVTFLTGQPMLMSTMSAPASTTMRRRLGQQRRLGAEDLHRQRALVGRDAQVAERALVAVVQAARGDHLGAHEARAEAPPLPPEGLHRDAGHGRQHDAARHLHGADAPGVGQAARGDGHARRVPAGGSTGVATIRDPAWRPRGVGCAVPPEGPLAKEIVLTREGYDKLRDELETLQTSRRQEVAARISQAREFGDISENSEYDDAKNEQAMLEAQIAQLEERLREARVIEEGELSSEEVVLGSHVTIDGPMGKETYQVVGSAEADPAEMRLSNESPDRQGDHGPPEGRQGQRDHAQRRGQRQDRRDLRHLGAPWPRCRTGSATARRSPTCGRATTACPPASARARPTAWPAASWRGAGRASSASSTSRTAPAACSSWPARTGWARSCSSPSRRSSSATSSASRARPSRRGAASSRWT